MSLLFAHESPLQMQPRLACWVGLNGALVLQQVHYWLNPRFNKNFKDNRHWVHNTYEGWGRQFPFWGERTIRRTMHSLEEAGLVLSYVSHTGFRKTKFYTLNYEALKSLGEACLFESHTSLSLISDQENTTLICAEEKEQDEGGHFGLTDQPVLSETCGQPDGYGQDDLTDLSLLSTTSGHLVHERPSGLVERTKWPEECGQPGHIKAANMAVTYNDKITTKITSPLPLKDQILWSKREKEEEDLKGKSDNKENHLKASEENTSPASLSSEKEEASKKTSQHMITFWTTHVQQKLSPGSCVHPTPTRLHNLSIILKDFFDNDLSKWEAYCTRLISIKFLRGSQRKEGSPSRFKMTFDWAIDPNNIAKILEGAIYDPDPALTSAAPLTSGAPSYETPSRTPEEPWDLFEATLKREQAAQGLPPEWRTLCLQLVKQTHQKVYKAWLCHLVPVTFEGTVAHFTVPNAFLRDYILRKYGGLLLQILRTHNPSLQSLQLTLGS